MKKQHITFYSEQEKTLETLRRTGFGSTYTVNAALLAFAELEAKEQVKYGLYAMNQAREEGAVPGRKKKEVK